MTLKSTAFFRIMPTMKGPMQKSSVLLTDLFTLALTVIMLLTRLTKSKTTAATFMIFTILFAVVSFSLVAHCACPNLPRLSTHETTLLDVVYLQVQLK